MSCKKHIKQKSKGLKFKQLGNQMFKSLKKSTKYFNQAKEFNPANGTIRGVIGRKK